ncbi:MAG: exopolysaccharide biosynthesis protein [Bacilli bacterium]|nr:exopolysaccharide biosynthesis protein [Bacilli bacterium]
MIFVTLGTQEKSFSRLLEAVEEFAKCHPENHIIVQSGHTKFVSNICEVFDYLSRDQMGEYYQKADLIITHGGVGSILEILQLGKKMIAIPRLKKYGEHINDHQLQIIDNFSRLGYLLPCYDLGQLEKTIDQIATFEPKHFVSNQSHFLDCLKQDIEQLLRS